MRRKSGDEKDVVMRKRTRKSQRKEKKEMGRKNGTEKKL